MIDDPEIPNLLRQIQTTDGEAQRRAWAELQHCRTEALNVAHQGEDEVERELRVALAEGG